MDYYPPSGFFFSVSIQGGDSLDAVFQEVSGISTEMEVERIQEGGENRINHQVPARIKISDNLVLSRGIVVSGSPFADWCFDTLQSGLAKKINHKSVWVELRDPESLDKSLATWIFDKAFPVKWEIAKFDAEQSKIVIEKLELAYAYFQYTPNG